MLQYLLTAIGQVRWDGNSKFDLEPVVFPCGPSQSVNKGVAFIISGRFQVSFEVVTFSWSLLLLFSGGRGPLPDSLGTIRNSTVNYSMAVHTLISFKL